MVTRGPWAYYVDFVLIPLAAILVTATEIYKDNLDWVWALTLLHGLVMFTLIEYAVHRWVLHKALWSGYHQRHHQHAAEYVVFPWWYLPLVFVVVWAWAPAPWFVGFLLGSLWFFGWHHGLHHWDLRRPGVIRRWLLAYSRWHDLHHKDLPCNYGITHPLWDLLLGTYMSTEQGRAALMARALALPRSTVKFKRRID